MGLNTEDALAVFPARVVSAFMKKRVEVPSCNTLLVAMDPSGGGSSSMSLVTTCMKQNQLTIVAFDESPIKDIAQMELMLMRHVRVLRQHYINHHLVFAFESNLGQEAGHAAAMLERNRVRNHYVIQEKDRVGVLTTASRKALYADNLLFYMNQQSIGLRKGGVLTGNPAPGEEARVLKVLHEQLTNYRRVDVEAGPGKLAKRHFTGKVAGSRQDDRKCFDFFFHDFFCVHTLSPCESHSQRTVVLTLQLSAYWNVRWTARSIPGVNFSKFD